MLFLDISSKADAYYPQEHSMNISLTPELEQMVDDKVKSGRYASASEVIREGLRLLEEQQQLKQQRF
jgi:putative addiction module CopG family antidote